MLIAILIILIALFLVAASVLYFEVRRKKYIEFVSQNSSALKELKALNEKYVFAEVGRYFKEHTYDNENFYDSISCSDYLVYQMQFARNELFTQIQKVKYNRGKNEEYKRNVSAIDGFGHIPETKGYGNKKLLLSVEKQLFDNDVQKPSTDLKITVTLNRSDLSGKIFEKKSETFHTEEIEYYLKKLANKRGSFYCDKDIWDSICRVERGRVSNKMRFSIYKRDGYRCCHCGRRENGSNLEIDHIIPIAKGGKSTYDNLQTLCSFCNKEKGDRF